MNRLNFIIFLAAINMTVYASPKQSCTIKEQPQLIKPIENWAIIAYNVAQIKTAPYFSGSHLIYTITHQKIKSKNKIAINSSTGEIKVDAETRDNFDIKVSAKNSCGTATSTFNIQIDEEE